MKLDYPGIGGSLGECVLCGHSFAYEIITGKSVQMISVEGFDCDLPVHKGCMTKMDALQGKDWTELPDGPLRQEYASAFAESTKAAAAAAAEEKKEEAE